MATRKRAAARKNAKEGAKARRAKEAAPPLEQGKNRAAVAQLTHKLLADLEKLDAQKKMINKSIKDRMAKYKADTGREALGTRDALSLAKMDPAARRARLADKLLVLEDLGMTKGLDLFEFQKAGDDVTLASDRVKEISQPGYIRSLGQQAFIDRKDFESHGYPEHAVREIDLWQQGFLAEKEKKEAADFAQGDKANGQGEGDQPAAE